MTEIDAALAIDLGQGQQQLELEDFEADDMIEIA